MLNALATIPNPFGPIPSTHRLGRGLPGYLILFAPHAFVPQRQYRPRNLPSPLVFLLISVNFTSTLGIPVSSIELQPCSMKRTSWVEPKAFTPHLQSSLRTLYAQSFRTTLAPFVLPRLLARSLPELFLPLPSSFSWVKDLYNPRAFFSHAASPGQSCLHCPVFPTAASRRSLDRISVPVWLAVL